MLTGRVTCHLSGAWDTRPASRYVGASARGSWGRWTQVPLPRGGREAGHTRPRAPAEAARRVQVGPLLRGGGTGGGGPGPRGPFAVGDPGGVAGVSPGSASVTCSGTQEQSARSLQNRQQKLSRGHTGGHDAAAGGRGSRIGGLCLGPLSSGPPGWGRVTGASRPPTSPVAPPRPRPPSSAASRAEWGPGRGCCSHRPRTQRETTRSAGAGAGRPPPASGLGTARGPAGTEAEPEGTSSSGFRGLQTPREKPPCQSQHQSTRPRV